MYCNYPAQRQLCLIKTKKIRHIFTLSIALFLSGEEYTFGQSLKNIKLTVRPFNSFNEGYNSRTHSYDGDFIRNITSNSIKRQVFASVETTFPEVTIKMLSRKDGGRCSPEKWRLAPQAAAAFVYTIKSKHPLIANRTIELDKVRKELPGNVSSRHANCFPYQVPGGMKRIYAGDCLVKLSVAIPTLQEMSLDTKSYTVQFDVVDKNNKVIATSSKEVVIASHVPVIVSVGESFASGEGNPDEKGRAADGAHQVAARKHCKFNTTWMIARDRMPDMEKKPSWLEREGHRSLLSFHALATKEMLKQWPHVIFLSFAKSGATIYSGDRTNDIYDQLADVRSLLGDYKIDALLISAGGNDVGFSGLLTSFASDWTNNDADHTFRIFKSKLEDLRKSGYQRINDRIKNLNLNVERIIINEYPGHIFNNSQGKPAQGCGIFNTFDYLKVSQRDAERMEDMGKRLNEAVKEAADKFGWYFVTGISDKFLKHGYCSSDPYYVGAEESCKWQGDFMGTMHPNAKGTRIAADAVAKTLHKLLPGPKVEQVKVR